MKKAILVIFFSFVAFANSVHAELARMGKIAIRFSECNSLSENLLSNCTKIPITGKIELYWKQGGSLTDNLRIDSVAFIQRANLMIRPETKSPDRSKLVGLEMIDKNGTPLGFGPLLENHRKLSELDRAPVQIEVRYPAPELPALPQLKYQDSKSSFQEPLIFIGLNKQQLEVSNQLAELRGDRSSCGSRRSKAFKLLTDYFDSAPEPLISEAVGALIIQIPRCRQQPFPTAEEWASGHFRPFGHRDGFEIGDLVLAGVKKIRSLRFSSILVFDNYAGAKAQTVADYIIDHLERLEGSDSLTEIKKWTQAALNYGPSCYPFVEPNPNGCVRSVHSILGAALAKQASIQNSDLIEIFTIGKTIDYGPELFNEYAKAKNLDFEKRLEVVKSLIEDPASTPEFRNSFCDWFSFKTRIEAPTNIDQALDAYEKFYPACGSLVQHGRLMSAIVAARETPLSMNHVTKMIKLGQRDVSGNGWGEIDGQYNFLFKLTHTVGALASYASSELLPLISALQDGDDYFDAIDVALPRDFTESGVPGSEDYSQLIVRLIQGASDYDQKNAEILLKKLKGLDAAFGDKIRKRLRASQ